jgi:hypothetical protein
MIVQVKPNLFLRLLRDVEISHWRIIVHIPVTQGASGLRDVGDPQGCFELGTRRVDLLEAS